MYHERFSLGLAKFHYHYITFKKPCDVADEVKEEPLKVIALDKIAALITAAFGLVAALAWNDAIKAIFKEIFGTADAIGPMLMYAIIITVIAVILTLTVARAASRAKAGMKQKIFECEICKFRSKIESQVMEHTLKEHTASQEKFLGK